MRIVFNGNGYDDAWVEEAERRGLLNLRTTPDALPYYISEKNIRLFADHRVFTETEVRSRYEIHQESYAKTIRIEALTMIDMVRKDVLPAVSAFTGQLAGSSLAKQSMGADVSYEAASVKRLSELMSQAAATVAALEDAVLEASGIACCEEKSVFCRDSILARMNELRVYVDEMETMTGAGFWPYPSYGDILFSVR